MFGEQTFAQLRKGLMFKYNTVGLCVTLIYTYFGIRSTAVLPE